MNYSERVRRTTRLVDYQWNGKARTLRKRHEVTGVGSELFGKGSTDDKVGRLPMEWEGEDSEEAP